MSEQLILVNLPTEILDHILSILLKEGGIRMIRHMSQTCKLFRDMIDSPYFINKLCSLLPPYKYMKIAALCYQIELPFHGSFNDFYRLYLLSKLNVALSHDPDVDIRWGESDAIVTFANYTIIIPDDDNQLWENPYYRQWASRRRYMKSARC